MFNKNNAGAMEKKTSLTELHLQNYAKHATVLCNLCQMANYYPSSIIMTFRRCTPRQSKIVKIIKQNHKKAWD